MTDSRHSRGIPWWAYVSIAAILYIALKYLAPAVPTEIPWIRILLQAGPLLAPIVSIGFLLLGAKALYDVPAEDSRPSGDEQDGKPI